MNKLLKRASSSDIISVLKDPHFASFILSVIFSQIAFNMMNVVLIFLVFNLSNSNFLVSLVVLTSIVPQIFLSFIGGILADVKNKKTILVYGNLLRGIAVVSLFFYSTSLPLIFFIALIISIITQFYVPAETPIIPKLIRKTYLISANAIFGICLFGSILVGYVFAGPAITIVGRSQIFLVLAAFFFIGAICASFIPSKLSEGTTHPMLANGWKNNLHKLLIFEFRKSLKLLREARNALQAFLLLVFSQVVILILATIIPGYAETILKIKPEKISLIIFAPAAVGMILTSLLIGSLFSKRNRNTLMNLGIFLSATALCLFPLTPQIQMLANKSFLNSVLPSILNLNEIHLVMILACLAGIANAFIFVPAQSTIQENTPEDARSKIYGLMFSVTGMLSFIPIILAGGVADLLGVGTALAMVGIAIFGIGIIRITGISVVKRFT